MSNSRWLLALPLAAALSAGTAAAQAELDLLPKDTDPAISTALEPHFVSLDKRVTARRLLYLYLPGTTLTAATSKLHLREAAGAGFHVLGLTYPNEKSTNEYCATSTDRECYEKVHDEVITGAPTSDLITVSRADSIENRTIKALQYLAAHFPADGWDAYLDGSGQPVWSKVTLAGFSQGTTHAAYIAKDHAVHRLALYAGPQEILVGFQSLPAWISPAHATATSAMYGFVHVQDDGERKLECWRALGMESFGAGVSVDTTAPPFNGSHMLGTNATPADPGEFHKSVIIDASTPKRADGTPVYRDVWRYVGGFDEPVGAPSTWLLPSSARAPGLNGAFFTTDLTVANTGAAPAAFTLRFLGNGVDGRGGAVRTFTLSPGVSATYADVLASVFSLASGFGAIQVASAVAALAVTSETSTAGAGGRFGQSVPAFAPSDLIGAGAPRSILAIREDATVRTNLVLANATEAELSVDVTLVSAAGDVLGTKRYTLPPLGMTQASRVVRDLGVAADVVGARLLLSTPTPNGAFAAYAAAIDNGTNDPRTLLPR